MLLRLLHSTFSSVSCYCATAAEDRSSHGNEPLGGAAAPTGLFCEARVKTWKNFLGMADFGDHGLVSGPAVATMSIDWCCKQLVRLMRCEY